ncbi:DUF1365 domain-containing protein [Phycicoccus sp. M110.8]|uniref:DUF1365 domain-containing protein n=1 Tax=Phycicoccus sp. M110.8 TaxID=3075433 RepID=UPI0028FDA394|nr:DUF1365 domain-containing protein [Phycicoccus sp. M110.8]MDU0314772.1 DUF1365 domain-containing protein [Phycicoccus sp. M110.8]
MRPGRGTRIYRTSIRHARTSPLRHRFAHRSHTWLVDLDDLPQLGVLAPLARFESRDHLGDPHRSLRQNLDTFLATQGIDLQGGRIRMLAMPRVLGTVFNPISIHWCHDRDDRHVATVVEVHNTYGDRHAYLVRPDERGRAEVDKALYVSPFNDVSGRYSLTVPEPDDRLHVQVVLHRRGHDPFVASMTGVAVPVTTRSVLRLALTQPLEPLAVMARIRLHGIRLWLRRLPVQPRPPHHQEAVQ